MAWWGPVIGGVASLLTGGTLSSKAKPQKYKTKQFPIFTPQQQGYQNQILQGLSGALPSGFQYLQNILSGSPESQQAMAAPYLRHFQESTIPGISERFSGVGGQSSSAFQQVLGRAGTGLEENLAALGEGQKMSALQALMGFGEQGMQPSFNTGFMPGRRSAMDIFGSLFGNIGSSLFSGGMNRWMGG